MNTEENQAAPETAVAQQAPGATTIQDLKPKMELQGKVTRLELYGAFIDLGIGHDGLLHISQLSTDHVRNVHDILSVGQEVKVWVRQVDPEQGRIDLTMLEPAALGWEEIRPGQELTGKVVQIEKYGAFVDVGAERPGMVHVSELANGYVNKPSDVVKIGDEVRVKVLKVSSKKKQLDLSMKALDEERGKVEVPAEEDLKNLPTAMELALRRAMQGTEMAEEFAAVTAKPAKPVRKGNDRQHDKQRKQQADIMLRTLQSRAK